jgi:hypothetical protein
MEIYKGDEAKIKDWEASHGHSDHKEPTDKDNNLSSRMGDMSRNAMLRRENKTIKIRLK